MTTYIAYSAADLRTLIGYWDDSESELVAGTAVAGDRVVIASNGTVDLGADDNIIMPAVGVWIDGPGREASTIQARLAIKGTGAEGVVTRFSGWQLDVNGLGAHELTGYADYGPATIEDTHFFAEDWGAINGNVTAGDGNTLTIVSRTTAGAIRAVFVNCLFDGAELDCLSTKGISSSGNAASVVECYRCVGRNPGATTSDQAFTCHDTIKMKLYGCDATGGTGKAAIASDAGTGMTAINCNIVGYALLMDLLSGCLIDRDTRETRIASLRPGGLMDHTYIFGTAYANQTGGGIYGPTSGTATISNSHIYCSDDSRVLAYQNESAGSGQILVDSVLIEGCYRGFDLRYGSGDDHEVTNCLIDTGQYSILQDANVASVAGSKANYATFPAGLITPAALNAGEVAALAAAVKPMVQPMPSWETARNSLLAQGGWARRALLKGLLLPI